MTTIILKLDDAPGVLRESVRALLRARRLVLCRGWVSTIDVADWRKTVEQTIATVGTREMLFALLDEVEYLRGRTLSPDDFESLLGYLGNGTAQSLWTSGVEVDLQVDAARPGDGVLICVRHDIEVTRCGCVAVDVSTSSAKPPSQLDPPHHFESYGSWVQGGALVGHCKHCGLTESNGRHSKPANCDGIKIDRTRPVGDRSLVCRRWVDGDGEHDGECQWERP